MSNNINLGAGIILIFGIIYPNFSKVLFLIFLIKQKGRKIFGQHLNKLSPVPLRALHYKNISIHLWTLMNPIATAE